MTVMSILVWQSCYKHFCNIGVIRNEIQIDEQLNGRMISRIKKTLKTYVLFKNEYYSENYVTFYTSHRRLSIIAQLRIGILPLHVETGIFCDVKLENKFVKYVKSGK